MKKLTAVSAALLVGASAVLPAAPAWAAPEPEFEFVLSDFCDFDVRIEGSGSESVRTFETGNGTVRTRFTYPASFVTLTNLTTGETTTRAVTGPAHRRQRPDGSQSTVQVGSWLHFAHPTSGEVGLFLTTGQVRYSSESGGDERVEIVGRVVDLCAVLDS